MSEEKKGFNLEIKPETAKGSYSNLAIISHSHSEFVLDFAQMMPGFPKPEVNQRVIMAPEHAKRLLAALQDNINKYENQYGPIDAGPKMTAQFPLDFSSKGTKS